MEDTTKLKCKKCKKKTFHKIKGFEKYNRRFECLICSNETEDKRNER